MLKNQIPRKQKFYRCNKYINLTAAILDWIAAVFLSTYYRSTRLYIPYFDNILHSSMSSNNRMCFFNIWFYKFRALLGGRGP